MKVSMKKLIMVSSLIVLGACGAPRSVNQSYYDPNALNTRSGSNTTLLNSCIAAQASYAGKVNGIAQKPEYCLKLDSTGTVCLGGHLGVGDFYVQINKDNTIAVIGSSMFTELKRSVAKVAIRKSGEQIWRDVKLVVNNRRKVDFSADDLGSNMIIEDIRASDLLGFSTQTATQGVEDILIYVSQYFDLSSLSNLQNNIITFTASEAVGAVPTQYFGFWQMATNKVLRDACTPVGTSTLNNSNSIIAR